MDDPWWTKLCETASLGLCAINDHAATENRYPKCVEGTRRQLIETINSTLQEEESGWTWLKGPARYGKSAVTSTTVETLNVNHNTACASFFFKKGDPICGSTLYFFPVICYQLVSRYPKIMIPVCEAIQQDPNLLKKEKPRRDQMEGLLCSALAPLMMGESPTLFIDAVDECNEDDARELLGLLADAAGRYPILRILLTSRPTSRMEGLLGQTVLRTISVQDFEATEDILILLNRRLDDIQRDHGLRMQKSWTKEQLTSLADSANSSFEIANAIIHHVKRSLDHADTLHSIMDPLLPTLNSLTTPTGLDEIYRHILTALPTTRRSLRFFCVLANLAEPITENTLNLLFSWDVHLVLDNLASLAFFSKGGAQIRVHDSLRYFLSDRKRCGDDFYIAPTQIHTDLARRCCEIIEDELLYSQTSGKPTIQYPFYPFRHWITHSLLAEPNEDLCHQLESFIEKHFFEWIFAISRSWHSGCSWTSVSIRDMCRDISQQTEGLVRKYEPLNAMAKSQLGSFNEYISRPSCHFSKSRDTSVIGFGETFDLQDGTLPNVVVIGRRGSGVSSLINLICGHEVARTTCDTRPCTSFLTAYVTTIGEQQFQLIDAPAPCDGSAVEEPWIDVFAAIQTLHGRHGIDLVIHCVHGQRAEEDDNIYWNLNGAVGKDGVPIVLAVTHLEEWNSMEDWWTSNKEHYLQSGMVYSDHACITAHHYDSYENKRMQSRAAVEKMIEEQCNNQKYSAVKHVHCVPPSQEITTGLPTNIVGIHDHLELSSVVPAFTSVLRSHVPVANIPASPPEAAHEGADHANRDLRAPGAMVGISGEESRKAVGTSSKTTDQRKRKRRRSSSSEINHDTPHSGHPCQWTEENGLVCGQSIDPSACLDHLAMHGVDLSGVAPIKCRWLGCHRNFKQQNITRHVRQKHLGVRGGALQSTPIDREHLRRSKYRVKDKNNLG